MARVVASGKQDFEEIISNDYFYVDKTNFIKEWWESGNDVTLITRPRRFGKTLTMNMVERFFSVKYQGEGKVFENLDVWKDEKYRQLQGNYPVIALSFADVKGDTYEEARKLLCRIIYEQYDKYRFLLDVDGLLSAAEKELFHAVSRNMEDDIAAVSLKTLSKWLRNYYGRKVIILLDEYDTPMQEAYVYGYWDKLVSFFRGLFNSTFKTNPYLGRAIMTGITRVSKESIFSDLNNLEAVTVTSDKYRDSFGFTQEEVSDALQEFGLSDREELVRDWYDGFTFGGKADIYNPWSIANFLEKRKFQAYWVNTSSNRLVDELIRGGNAKVKMAMEDLLDGNILRVNIDEQIVFNQLNYNENAIWSLLLASGYLKAENCQVNMETGEEEYDLKITNKEVLFMFRKMIKAWFGDY
ncbi:MAG: AAA family ATPase, partial [Lachnospiraceae bacterium]|nr:AAA family ATPase [Lachnospiraceae bacterium]